MFTSKVPPSRVEAGAAAARSERVISVRVRARVRARARGDARVAALLLRVLSLVLRRHILLKEQY